jgi:diguanylate cyclase
LELGADSMLQDLFINGAILIAVISLGNQILINQDVTPSSPWKLKLFFSTAAGILGVLLMLNSVKVTQGIILDFRNIAVVLSAAYCGFLPAIITGLIIGIFRLLYTGLSYIALLGSLNVLIIAFACGLINNLKISKSKKWTLMGICIIIISNIMLSLVINDRLTLFQTVIFYTTSMVIVLLLVYYYVKYIDLLRYTYRKYQRESVKDHLTGLNNVRQFVTQLSKISSNLTDESLISMLFIDIDYFKKINDSYGHQNGDKILEDLGKILFSKSNNTDFVFRNGGEEFSVLMTDCPREKILEVAERIRKAVQDHKFYLYDSRVIRVTVSIGVAIYPDSVKDINQLVKKADEALYEAKRTGRNMVVISKPTNIKQKPNDVYFF